METITISDAEPQLIISNIASYFDVEPDENPNSSCVEIPESHGKGHIKLFKFPLGVSTLEIKMDLKDDLHFNYESGYVHPLKLMIVKSGKVRHAFNKSEKERFMNAFESVLLASTPHNNHSFTFLKQQAIHLVSVQINRKEFEPKISGFTMDMHPDISRVIRDLNGIQKFYYKNFISPKTIDVFEELSKNSYDNFMESVFLEAKTYELIALQLKQYLVNLESPNASVLFLPKTLQKIKKAVTLIEKDIETYDSVKQLSQSLTINEKTLQSGFKKLYNCTVNAYIRNYRAQQAKRMLETSSLSVAEISYKLGISSPNYLSRLFKSYYGVTPSTFREKLKGSTQL